MAIVNTIARDTDWQAIIVSNITADTMSAAEIVPADQLRYWTTGNSALSIARIRWSGNAPSGGVSILFKATANVTACQLHGTNGSYGGTDGFGGFKVYIYNKISDTGRWVKRNSTSKVQYRKYLNKYYCQKF